MSVFKFKNFSLEQSDNVFKIGTDAVVLSACFLKYTSAVDKALDIGTGNGVLGHVIASNYPSSEVIGIDINEHAIHLADKNKNLNQISNLNFIHNSISKFSSSFKFDVIISNPPFFSNSIKSKKVELSNARHDDALKLSELLYSAKNLLTENGMFWFIYPYQRIREVRAVLEKEKLYIHREIIVFGKPNTAERIIFVLGKKLINSAKEEITIRNSQGTYTEDYKMLTRDIHGKKL